MKIDSFFGPYWFLSNFYPCKIEFEGLEYSSVEAAYQAAKSDNPIYRQNISKMDAGNAKRYGRTVELKPLWDLIKISIMRNLLFEKFSKDKGLQKKLLETGDSELIEGNSWGDKFWGVCDGEGENNLGVLLMQLRKSLPNYLRVQSIVEKSFKIEWCTLCDTYFVRCPKCGNNCCNASYGLKGECNICSLCYEIQDTIDRFVYLL